MSTIPNQPTPNDNSLDDRMQIVVNAYYRAIADGDDVLAAALARAMDTEDVEAGLAAIEAANQRRKP